MIVLSNEQLTEVLTGLPAYYPKSLQVDSIIRRRLTGQYTWPGTEIVVDKFPDYSVLMFRPIKDSPDYVPWPRVYCVVIFCRKLDELEKIIRSDDFVDWTKPVAFFALSKKDVFPVILKRVEELGGAESISEEDSNGVVHLLHPSHMVKSELPDGFRLGELTEEHAERVNNDWHYGSSTSLNFFKFHLRNKFPSSAVFTNEGRLVAYILYKVDGSMFHGYVQPEYRKKGLYQVVNYDLAEKIVALKLPTAWVYVMRWNGASLAAYRKLGAIQVDPEVFSVDWTTFTPPKK